MYIIIHFENTTRHLSDMKKYHDHFLGKFKLLLKKKKIQKIHEYLLIERNLTWGEHYH